MLTNEYSTHKCRYRCKCCHYWNIGGTQVQLQYSYFDETEYNTFNGKQKELKEEEAEAEIRNQYQMTTKMIGI